MSYIEVRDQRNEAKFHKAEPKGKSRRCQTLSGRILAGLLVPEPKTSLKCSITSLVSGTNLRSFLSCSGCVIVVGCGRCVAGDVLIKIGEKSVGGCDFFGVARGSGVVV